jgi:hypothetical protein
MFEVGGASFPDTPSNPGNRHGDQIQNRAKHENFKGAVPFAQSRKKHTERPVGNRQNAPGNETGNE